MKKVDPPVQIDPSVWATYEAAHVQADAAVRAAEISAQAAWNASVLQISAAIIAAVAALMAGRWAYHAAIKAAERQTHLENKKYDAKVAAYGIRQEAVLKRLLDITHREKGVIEWQDSIRRHFDSENDDKKTKRYYILLIDNEEPHDWKDENWEEHALLGELFVEQLIYIKHDFMVLKEVKKNTVENSKRINENLPMYKIEDVFENNETDVYLINAKSTFEIFEIALLEFEKAIKNSLKSLPGRAHRKEV